MTYCSEILKQKETEIQQLKKENSEITMEREVFLERNRLLQMQVEAAKTLYLDLEDDKHFGVKIQDLFDKFESEDSQIREWDKDNAFNAFCMGYNLAQREILKVFSEGFSEKSSLGETTKPLIKKEPLDELSSTIRNRLRVTTK